MRVGVVGCGKIGGRHVDAYRQIGGVDVLVADEDSQRAKDLAEKAGVGVVPPEQLVNENLDALDVCVPTLAHKRWILAALDAGLHVFCEKPLCLSGAEAVEIHTAALRAQRNVSVGYLYRHHPAFRFAKETIDYGIIGEPYFALARLGGRGSHRPWKHERLGGGVVFEMMVHLLDLLSWLLGPLEDGRLVFEDVLLPRRLIDGEEVTVSATDCAVVTLRAGGVRSICQSDLVTPSFMNHVELQGSNGSLLTSILDFIPTVVYCKEPRASFDRGHNYRRFEPANLFCKELSSFIELVRSEQLNERPLLESLQLSHFVDSLIGKEIQ